MNHGIRNVLYELFIDSKTQT